MRSWALGVAVASSGAAEGEAVGEGEGEGEREGELEGVAGGEARGSRGARAGVAGRGVGERREMTVSRRADKKTKEKAKRFWVRLSRLKEKGR